MTIDTAAIRFENAIRKMFASNVRDGLINNKDILRHAFNDNAPEVIEKLLDELDALRSEITRLESKYANLHSAVAAILANPNAVDKRKLADIEALMLADSQTTEGR